MLAEASAAKLALLLTALAAASPSATTRDASEFFTARIRGAQTADVRGPGFFACMEDKSPASKLPHRILLSDGKDKRPVSVVISVPQGLAPGAYPIKTASIETTGKVVDAYVVFWNDPDFYRLKVSGRLHIEQMPQGFPVAGSQPVRGRFQFSAANGAGKDVNVTGRFSFEVDLARNSDLACQKRVATARQ